MIHDMDTMKSRRTTYFTRRVSQAQSDPRSISAPPNYDDDAHFFLMLETAQSPS